MGKGLARVDRGPGIVEGMGCDSGYGGVLPGAEGVTGGVLDKGMHT
ncbi:hypothetical protein GCM10009760_48160 [Kitasatospora kazusensis]|uniref:Uncharacterized protein n=1 Tax=Kitasatospora kazusensis TaxID=407974 RepID=A0ABN3A1H7_9ACTN